MVKQRKINNYKLKIGVLFVVLVAVSVLVISLIAINNKKNNTTKDTIDDSQMLYASSRLTTYAYNDYYKLDVPVFKNYLGNNLCYSLDFQGNQPKQLSTISFLGYLSSVNTAVFRYGYPQLTPEQLGVENEEEAIEATQFAIWYLGRATKNNDTSKSEYVIDLDNFITTSENEEAFNRIITAAFNIADKALNNPYYANPQFNVIKEEAVIYLYDDYAMVGPYIIEADGFDLSQIEVGLENGNDNISLCDESGNHVTDYKNGDSVFIKMPKTAASTLLTLSIKVSGSYIAGEIYGTGADDDNIQNYAVTKTLPVEFTESVNIDVDCNQEPEESGKLKVIATADDSTNGVSGVEITIYNNKDEVIDVLTTDNTGKAYSKSLEYGTYKYKETSVPDGYEVDKESYVVKITEAIVKRNVEVNKQ